MPTLTKYAFSKATDFPGGFDSDRLQDDIQKSALITIALDRIDTSGDAVDVWFKDVLPAADKTALDGDVSPAAGVIGAHTGLPLSTPVSAALEGPTTADKKLIVATWPTEGSKTTLISPNWADRTTWYDNAVRVAEEVANEKVPGQYDVYSLANTNVIDTYHGKVSGENFLLDSAGNSYRVSVTVNAVAKTEVDPHDGAGDYTVDHTAGELTFSPGLASGDEVKVTYHYENGSSWAIKPAAGRVLKIRKAEVQFSQDIILMDTVLFQPYGPVEIWAPAMVDDVSPNYSTTFPTGFMLPLGNPEVMKTMMDYVNDANGSYPTIPAIGGAGWRGNDQIIHTFPWDYQAVTDVSSAGGVEIRISLEHDTAFGGTVATATFYCLSVDEA